MIHAGPGPGPGDSTKQWQGARLRDRSLRVRGITTRRPIDGATTSTNSTSAYFLAMDSTRALRAVVGPLALAPAAWPRSLRLGLAVPTGT